MLRNNIAAEFIVNWVNMKPFMYHWLVKKVIYSNMVVAVNEICSIAYFSTFKTFLFFLRDIVCAVEAMLINVKKTSVCRCELFV
jgi:hypothetical protein